MKILHYVYFNKECIINNLYNNLIKKNIINVKKVVILLKIL